MEDILEERRRTGDLWWVTKHFKTPVYRHRKPRTPQDIRDEVLKNVAVQAVIDEVTARSERTREDVEEETRTILDHMGHEFTMKAVRLFGILLSKSWKRIYRCVNVNPDGIETLRKLVPLYPIILLPTHRSYVDFLVISFAFFYYNLPIPIIAAGQDFMNMRLVGSLMRHAGAFFIRRSFGKDKLYWTAFSEYVKTHVINGEAPLEFFIEGTRSRSAKSLPPKLGLFTSSLEPFFKADVPDILVVPVSISYDRTLEEVLYVYELLGVPKPKETTRGLLKARKILGDDYGNFYMHVGKPVSVREFCGRRIDRTIHNLGPRHLSPLSAVEHQIVDELAHEMLKAHQQDLIIPPFVFIAAILSNYMQQNCTEVPLLQLVDDTRWLWSFVQNIDANVYFDHHWNAMEVVLEACKVHHNLITITENGMVRLNEIHSSSPSIVEKVGHLQEQTLCQAVSHLLLSHYANQMLNVLTPVALVAVALNTRAHSVISKADLFQEFRHLTNILSMEFVIGKNIVEDDFEKALSLLRIVEAVQQDDSGNLFGVRKSKVFTFLTQLFDPFISAYSLACRTLLNPEPMTYPANAKEIAKRIQEEAEGLLFLPHVTRHQFTILSLDTLTNAVYALHATGALKKDSRNGAMSYYPVEEELVAVAKRLESHSEWLAEITDEHLGATFQGRTRAKL